MHVLDRLAQVLDSRRNADPAKSYVARLHQQGINKILEKVGEEAVETIIAAKDAAGSGATDALVRETADLWFHCLVLLARHGLGPSDVLAELQRREGIPGLDEKAARKKK